MGPSGLADPAGKQFPGSGRISAEANVHPPPSGKPVNLANAINPGLTRQSLYETEHGHLRTSPSGTSTSERRTSGGTRRERVARRAGRGRRSDRIISSNAI